MSGHLRHGFKADAERLAVAVREEFGLRPHDPLNCMEVCEQLGIPTITVPTLVNSGASPKSIECLLKEETKFSAMTIAIGSKRLIVYNPRQPVGRRANSVAHELSHILLEHPMGSALGEGGCRRWNAVVEAEADWQAATLLVPRPGALEWIRSGGSLGMVLNTLVSARVFSSGESIKQVYSDR